MDEKKDSTAKTDNDVQGTEKPLQEVEELNDDDLDAASGGIADSTPRGNGLQRVLR